MCALLPIPFICLIGGWLLVRRGAWLRVGETPYCRRCSYNLTGSASTCPECGSDLSARRAVLRGERRFRPVRFGAGLLLLLMGSTYVYGVIQATHWPGTLPTWVWIAAMNRHLATDTATRELARRVSLGVLTPGEYTQVTANAVRWHGEQRSESLVVLGPLFDRGWILEETLEAVWAQSVTTTFTGRTVVNAGDPLPCTIRMSTSMLDNSRVGQVEGLATTRVHGPNGQILGHDREPFPVDIRGQLRGFTIHRAQLRLPPGRHTLTAEIDVLLTRPIDAGSAHQPIMQQTQRHTLDVLVRPEGGTDIFERVSGPAVEAEMRAAFGPLEAWVNEHGSITCRMALVRPTTYSVPLELSVEPARDEWFRPGWITPTAAWFEYHGGGSTWFLEPVDEVPETLRLRVRGSRELALELFDEPVFEGHLWEGEILFDPVPVALQPPGEARRGDGG